jgi:hypothetical protein
LCKKNIDNACVKILRESNYLLSDFAPSGSLLSVDTDLAVALEKGLREVENMVYEIRETKPAGTYSAP